MAAAVAAEAQPQPQPPKQHGQDPPPSPEGEGEGGAGAGGAVCLDENESNIRSFFEATQGTALGPNDSAKSSAAERFDQLKPPRWLAPAAWARLRALESRLPRSGVEMTHTCVLCVVASKERCSIIPGQLACDGRAPPPSSAAQRLWWRVCVL